MHISIDAKEIGFMNGGHFRNDVFMSLTSCCFSVSRQPWDRTSTPTQSLQRMSMATTPEKGLSSRPFGIEVSH
jgi:hypothetical protein